jgi:hypothetical protein
MRLAAPVLLVAAMLPSLAWLARDQSVWPFDQAWYGQESLVLYLGLLHSPRQWLYQMTSVFGIKAPAIAWIGQLFVPLGQTLGSIEIGLLLLIFFCQIVTLLVLFFCYHDHAGGRIGPALVGALSVAVAPLFVAMTHQYFVEPLQTLAVAWFIAIMVFGARWRTSFLLSQLVGAAAFAMLVKASSPIYCVAPGLVGLFYLVDPDRRRTARARPNIACTVVTAAVVICLTIGTMAWYIVNWTALTHFVVESSSGSVASLYGERASFPVKLGYWLRAAQQNFFYFPTLFVVGVLGLAASGMAMWGLRNRGAKVGSAALHVGVAVVEIALVLALFSLQVNDEQRYLQPLGPYVGLLVAASLAVLNRTLLSLLAASALGLQWGLVYAQALGFASANFGLGYWLLPPHTDSQDRADVTGAVAETCGAADVGRYNVVGVELGWFNSNSLSFYSAKRELDDAPRCYYTSLGYAETDVDKAWQRMLDLNVDHFATVDPSVVRITDDAFNSISVRILERAEISNLFVLQPRPDHSRIVVLTHLAQQ